MISQQVRSWLEPLLHGSFATPWAGGFEKPVAFPLLETQQEHPYMMVRWWKKRQKEMKEYSSALVVDLGFFCRDSAGLFSSCWYCLYSSPPLNNSAKLNAATVGQQHVDTLELQTLHGSTEGAWIIQSYTWFSFVNPEEMKGFSYLNPCFSGDCVGIDCVFSYKAPSSAFAWWFRISMLE